MPGNPYLPVPMKIEGATVENDAKDLKTFDLSFVFQQSRLRERRAHPLDERLRRRREIARRDFLGPYFKQEIGHRIFRSVQDQASAGCDRPWNVRIAEKTRPVKAA